MSRKGVTTICKTKQIPRIFQRRNQSICGIGRTVWDGGVVLVDESIDSNDQRYSNSSLDSSENNRRRADDEKRSRPQPENGGCENVDYSTRGWSSCCQTIGAVDGIPVTIDSESIDKSAVDAADTVADIEKWLKIRTESVSSMDLDAMKSEAEEEGGVAVDRYLADDLPHAFLGKDHDGLSIDMDLTDKKLSMDYDPILQELRSDKLLEACGKNDDFVLPEFQLDHLDPLALSPDDMMVAGEILPSASNQPSLVADVDDDDSPGSPVSARDEEDLAEEDAREPSGESVAKGSTYEPKEEITEETNFVEEDSNFLVSEIAEFVQLAGTTVSELAMDARSTTGDKSKSKLEPRIMKRGRRAADKANSNGIIRVTGEERCVEGKDGIMAVVAISTDKISNMTQIVINNGKEEQIYQGRTSELIEATGNFPKLSKIDSTGNWSNGTDYGPEGPPSTQTDTAITNALEELGITDECLQPTTVNENGKTWVCPRDDCNREFTKLHALKGHLLAHYGVRPFKVYNKIYTVFLLLFVRIHTHIYFVQSP